MAVRLHGKTGLPLDGFWWNVIFEPFFSKIWQENSSFIEIKEDYRILYLKTFWYLWQYLAKLFLEWEMFQTKVVEKFKTHILCSVTFFENRAVYEIMSTIWWNLRGHKWRHNMAHTRCMLDKQGYVHLLACTRTQARARKHTDTNM